MAMCSICFSSLKSDQICATECGHVFHHTCLHTWYQTNQSCPICRKIIRWTFIKPVHLNFDEDTIEDKYICETEIYQERVTKLRQEIAELKAINKDLKTQLTQESEQRIFYQNHFLASLEARVDQLKEMVKIIQSKILR